MGWGNILSNIFGGATVKALRAKATAKAERRREADAAARASGNLPWHVENDRLGLGTVKAKTKSEARAKFKALLRGLEEESFHPQLVTRLPAGMRVVCPLIEAEKLARREAVEARKAGTAA